MAHVTVGYWPWREGATRAARSVLVNPNDIAQASLHAYNDPKKAEWQRAALRHDSLCMLEMRLKDLMKSSGGTHENIKNIVVRSPTLLETTSVFAPTRHKGARAFQAAPDQVLRRVRKYTSMGEPHAGLVEHVEAVGDPDRCPFALLGLPAASSPDSLTRFLTCPRTKQHGLDLVVADLTRVGRSDIQDDWEKKLEVFLTALDGFEGRRPAVLVVTEESFVQRRAFRLLKSHAETRRPKKKAQQLGVYLDHPTLLGPATELPAEMPPISFQADIKDASLAPLRRDLVALGQRMREAGAGLGAEAVSRTLAFVRRCASLPLGLQEARETADILYDADDDADAAVRAMFRPRMSATTGPQRMLPDSPIKAVGGGWYTAHSPASDEFSSFESYDINDWDGYGAKPITADTVKAARSFRHLFDQDIPPADIAPGADGTIGFEWRLGAPDKLTRILIDVGPGGRVFARRIDEQGHVTVFSPTRVETSARELLREIFSS